jgi:hypothetical protein
MGELVAWVLGAGLGFTARTISGGLRHTLFFALSVVGLGTLVTLLSGEMYDEPWLVILDIGQVAIAAVCGRFVLYPIVRRWRAISRTASGT